MTAEFVSLVLGLCAIGAVVYGIRTLKSERTADSTLVGLKSQVEGFLGVDNRRADALAALEARIAKIEKALQMEPPKPKAALPGFMR